MRNSRRMGFMHHSSTEKKGDAGTLQGVHANEAPRIIGQPTIAGLVISARRKGDPPAFYTAHFSSCATASLPNVFAMSRASSSVTCSTKYFVIPAR
jgi:hypothetical protein